MCHKNAIICASVKKLHTNMERNFSRLKRGLALSKNLKSPTNILLVDERLLANEK